MAVVPYQGFIGGTYRTGSPRIGVEQCLNMIPVVHGGPAVRPTSPLSYIRTPGSRLFSEAGNGPIRGMFSQDGRMAVVSGAEAYSIAASGAATKLGDVATSQLPAYIDANGSAGTQFMFTTGGSGYIWNWNTSSFTQITDVDFPANVQSCAFSDGYFLALGLNTRQVNYSALFDGTSWGSTDLIQKTQSADNIRNMSVVNKLIYLLGSQKTEIWQNTGDALVTFAPLPGVLIEQGIDAFAGICKAGNTLVWMGLNEAGKGRAYMDVNFTPVPISHSGVEEVWATYDRTDDAILFPYLYKGHLFVVVTFPTANATWVADMNTNPPIWHEWGYLNPATGMIDAHLARCHTFAFNKHLVGSRVDGKIYELTGDCYTDDADVNGANGDPIRRTRRAPHIFVPQRSMEIHRFAMQVDPGVAATSGQGSDPVLMFKYSVDGGKTYSNELFLETGALGEYDTQVEVNRLGSGVDWVLEVSTSEPVDHNWSGASLDATPDAH